MNELDELLKQQLKAIKFGDFVELNNINKRIFELRQQQRKQKAKAKELELDKKIDEKIIEMMTK